MDKDQVAIARIIRASEIAQARGMGLLYVGYSGGKDSTVLADLVTDFDGESAGDVVFERKGTPWYFGPRIPSGKTVAALAPDCYQWRARMDGSRENYTLKIRQGCCGG